MSARLSSIVLRRLSLPLVTPYRLSYRTFEKFEPIMVELWDDRGRGGFGEGHISPGSGSETRDGGWAFARRHAQALLGMEPSEAKAQIDSEIEQSPVAATALITAIEMLGGHPLLDVIEAARLPLLSPVNGVGPEEIHEEIEEKLLQGFRTFKVKVGKDVASDLERLTSIQAAVDGRAMLRVDANRGFNRKQAMHFATCLNPESVELFEQPCAAEDWDANAAVAQVSNVPLMLDEPICTVDDIERAATLQGVGYVKLKLKRFGGIERLHAALIKARELGLKPVLGDGLGSEPMCWMEACVARSTIDNASEFNGFLKLKDRLFAPPLCFDEGDIVLKASDRPAFDRKQLDRLTVECLRFD